MTPSDKRYLGGGLRIASGSAAPLRLDHGYFEHEVRPMLGSILVQKGWITHERLDEALGEVKVTGMRLGETLLARGWLYEPELAAALAEQAGLRYVDLVRHPLDPLAARLLPLEVARRMRSTGVVVVEVVIDENGKVISASALSGPGILRDVAVQAAFRARFSPTKLSGQPVKVTGTINYKFTLGQ